jgi:hypothetical protein
MPYHGPEVLIYDSRVPSLPQVDLVSVVGKPLELPLIPNPTKEDVTKWHVAYIEALVDVFERNKQKYAADPSAVLEVF